MARRKKPSEGGANWMDTYGDMVTLLLCFFVLLYSISSVDSAKWTELVKSFNPNADVISQIVVNGDSKNGDAVSPSSADANDAFDRTAQEMIELLSANLSTSENVDVSSGDGYIFISFNNNIFFDGDSYVLRQEGKEVLDEVCKVIKPLSEDIQEIQILGHTSQADPVNPNEPVSDRFLSSNRATTVLLYIQNKGFVDPAKLVSIGYGQFRPISSFETKESRSRNRRVEMIITKSESVSKQLEEYYSNAYNIE